MDTISIIVGLLAGIIVGGAIIFVVVNWLTTRKRDQIIGDAEAQAETIMKDKMVKANVVDHITPHRGDKKLFWDENNWQALCKHHHDKKTMTEDKYQEYKY